MTYLIDILLPTYNGEKFLSAQIDSLIDQTYRDWRLIIRDDLSSDNTPSLIYEYQNKYPDRIYVLDNQSIKKGVVGSFECLIEASTSRYLAFCDQDDIWNPDKLELQLSKMHELEKKHGDTAPLLIHTDLTVVDNSLQLIGDSLWKYQHFYPEKMSSLPRLLAQNCVTGCTMVINRSMADLVVPIPKGVVMHDWWMALIAVSEGVLCDMKVSTVKYRQHDKNDTGAKQWGLEFIIKWISRGREMQLRSLLRTRTQAEALINVNIISNKNKKIVERYIAMYSGNWFARRFEMIRMGFFKYGVLKNIAMFLRI